LGRRPAWDTMQMMDHAEATRKLAAERYLLGELNEAERQELEEHFFECSDCLEAVEAGRALIANAREVWAAQPAFARPAAAERKSWWQAWTLWRLVPAAALAGWAVAAVLAGYQFLRRPSPGGQLVIAPAVSVRAARARQSLSFSKRQPVIAFEIAPEWQQFYTAYEAQIERSASRRPVFTSTIASGRETPDPLTVAVRTAPLQPGTYALMLYGLESASRTPLERISFTLTE